jgi:hypothetical protein
MKHDPKRSKADALLEEGTLNPAPEKVLDPKFRTPYPRERKAAPFGRLARESGQFVDQAQVGARVGGFGFVELVQ